jgi:hypothetical protein
MHGVVFGSITDGLSVSYKQADTYILIIKTLSVTSNLDFFLLMYNCIACIFKK